MASVETDRKLSVVFCTATTRKYGTSRRVTVVPFGVVNVVTMLVNRPLGIVEHGLACIHRAFESGQGLAEFRLAKVVYERLNHREHDCLGITEQLS